MKYIITLLLLFVIVSLCSIEFKENMFQKDKLYHIGASFLSAQAGYVACRTNGVSQHNSRITAMLFSFSVGIGKEAYDAKLKKPPTGFSYYDLFADVIGTGCALIMINNIQN